MEVDVTIYNKNIILKEDVRYNFDKYQEVNYIGSRYEPYQTIASVILHTKEMQKQYRDIGYQAILNPSNDIIDTKYHYHVLGERG